MFIFLMISFENEKTWITVYLYRWAGTISNNDVIYIRRITISFLYELCYMFLY